jgi:hypothetical protein
MDGARKETNIEMADNQGCLGWLLGLIGIQLGEKDDDGKELDHYPFRLRDDFLSRAELSFYLTLQNHVTRDLRICPKVSLADLFYVVRPNENLKAYNKINRKHVDFVACDPVTMKPLFGIELDDASHQQPERKQRDEFVEEVFQAASLPLVRVPARAAYNTEELRALISPYLPGLKEEITEPRPPALVENGAPTCPKCGVPMVLRTARQGPYAGRQFYGCPNYPRCHEMVPVEE